MPLVGIPLLWAPSSHRVLYISSKSVRAGGLFCEWIIRVLWVSLTFHHGTAKLPSTRTHFLSQVLRVDVQLVCALVICLEMGESLTDAHSSLVFNFY